MQLFQCFLSFLVVLCPRFLEARLGKPSLIRDTSRYSLGQAMKHPIKFTKKIVSQPQDPLKGIILNVGNCMYSNLSGSMIKGQGFSLYVLSESVATSCELVGVGV